MFGINDAHMTISSTRKKYGLFYCVLNRAIITLGVVGLLLTMSSTRNLLFPSMTCLTESGKYWTLLTFSSPRNLLLLLHGYFFCLHPAFRFSFPYHPLSLVLELETHPSSLLLVPGQKPWHCTFLLRLAGRLSPPSQFHHGFIFILSKWFPTISVHPYDLLIFEEKSHICKVTSAMFSAPSLSWSLISFTIVFGVYPLLQPWSD